MSVVSAQDAVTNPKPSAEELAKLKQNPLSGLREIVFPPFKFTGKINKLTFKLEPVQSAEADKKAATVTVANANDCHLPTQSFVPRTMK
jgi:hypothetical protein